MEIDQHGLISPLRQPVLGRCCGPLGQAQKNHWVRRPLGPISSFLYLSKGSDNFLQSTWYLTIAYS